MYIKYKYFKKVIRNVINSKLTYWLVNAHFYHVIMININFKNNLFKNMNKWLELFLDDAFQIDWPVTENK